MNWKKIKLFEKFEQFKKNRTEIEQTEIKERGSLVKYRENVFLSSISINRFSDIYNFETKRK